jgi:3-oxoacyl-[acyl-carrier protein] reductase
MLSAEQKQEAPRSIPAGRIGAPADVAGLIAFLLSEQAAYITGQTVVIDGGLTA